LFASGLTLTLVGSTNVSKPEPVVDHAVAIVVFTVAHLVTQVRASVTDPRAVDTATNPRCACARARTARLAAEVFIREAIAVVILIITLLGFGLGDRARAPDTRNTELDSLTAG
jgi:hypothetical protein